MHVSPAGLKGQCRERHKGQALEVWLPAGGGDSGRDRSVRPLSTPC